PKLPPSTVRNDGAVQLLSPLRHITTPFPYRPPIPMPPLDMPATIATHSVLSNRFAGTPLSGVLIISLKTSAARLSRLVSSERSPRRGGAAIAVKLHKTRTANAITCFISSILPSWTVEVSACHFRTPD